MRAKKKVDLDRLAAALPDYPFAYLITVDDGYRVHTVTVEPRLRDGSVLDVGAIGGRTRENLARRAEVTLLWPPREPGGYSLIVDGAAEVSGDDAGRLNVVPSRALLHRDADPDSPEAAKGCLHDCVVFSLPA
ncbi:pyridoxamine 5'-phosphate oxidase family protein [Mycobacterium sp. 050134]|uniref:pyridoxamine 5'-phosphate oxidase family protein n=1 Tax=Mycobacterium sp. 050134 TaxID=3096111 RepID=UPI002EDB937B